MAQSSLGRDLVAAPPLAAPVLPWFGLVQVLLRALPCVAAAACSLASLAPFQGQR